MQQRRIGLHRVEHIDDMWQDFVLDLDQFQRALRDRGVCRADGGHGVAFEQDLVLGHDRRRDVVVVDHHLAGWRKL